MTVTRSLTLLLVAGTLGGTLLVSSRASSSTTAGRGGAGGVAEVVAEVGGRRVTMADVDGRWQRDDPTAHAEATEALYEGRRAAMQEIVGDLLVERAASSRGMTREQFIELEMAQRIDPISETDVIAFHAANAELLGGGSVEPHRERIEAALLRQARRRAYGRLVAELASASPRDVRVHLEPPRQFTPVLASDPALGPADAPVTIVAFSDFQCPFCARVEPTLATLRQMYGDRVRVVWKDFPLVSIHPEAPRAAEASHCAAEQGKYWEYHDHLFANQGRMDTGTLQAHAAALGLDTTSFMQCLASSRYAARVQAGIDAGRRLGVEATPTLFVNGRAVRGAQPLEVFATIIDEELTRLAVDID